MARVNALVVQDKARIKETRLALAGCGYYDATRRISQTEEHFFALPITTAAVDQLVPSGAAGNATAQNGQPIVANFRGSYYSLICADLPPSKKAVASAKTNGEALKIAIQQILSQIESPLSSEKRRKMLSDIPASWERHGDLVVLSSQAFRSPEWKQIISETVNFWNIVANALNCCRLARDSKISSDAYRSSSAEMLLGDNTWVEHIDNRIKYVFDVTHIMFSSGNITEKLRVAQFDCRGETVVDLYAGIGYFTLPYLLHSRADVVHACEWNAKAVEGLRSGLEANGVVERCVIHVGDCREVCPQRIAHRVNLGLIPSSEGGWPTACAALRPETGGWLHIHGNVCWRPGQEGVRQQNPWEMGKGWRDEGGDEGGGGRGEGKVVGEEREEEWERCGVGERDGRGRKRMEDDGQVVIGEMSLKCVSGSCEIQKEEMSKDKKEKDGFSKESVAATTDSEKIRHKHLPISHKKAHHLVGDESLRPQPHPPSPPSTEDGKTQLRRQARKSWESYIVGTIGRLLPKENPLCEGWRWDMRVGRVGTVKTYAPFVDHVVADVECRPIPSTGAV